MHGLCQNQKQDCSRMRTRSRCVKKSNYSREYGEIMATTGRLTAAQRTAIRAGNPIRQAWYVHVPVNSSHSGYVANLLDVGIFPAPASVAFQRVIRAGSRSHHVWNPTPNVKKSPSAVRYSFVVDNSDGRMFENSSDNFYQVSGTYQAVPQECYVRHLLYVAIYSSSGVTWSNLSHMNYEGGIYDLRHEDTADAQGNVIGAQTTIMCEQKGAWDALRRDWTIDDCTDVAMTNGATADYVWTV